MSSEQCVHSLVAQKQPKARNNAVVTATGLQNINDNMGKRLLESSLIIVSELPGTTKSSTCIFYLVRCSVHPEADKYFAIHAIHVLLFVITLKVSVSSDHTTFFEESGQNVPNVECE